MVQSCLRTKVCKLCWVIILAVLTLISFALWHKAVQDGSVELVIPTDLPPVDGLVITVLPEEPRVTVGETAQLVCITTGATVSQFSPPSSLSPSLLSSVHTTILPGGAVLTVRGTEKGHAGFYTCQAVGPLGQDLQLSVRLTVDAQANTDPEQPHPPSSPNSPITTSPHTPHTLTSQQHNSSLVVGRRIQVESSDTEERQKREAVKGNVDEEDESVDLAALSLLQRSSVANYCSRYDPHPSHTLHHLAFDRHNLLDHIHRVLFCFMPKVGCTNLKLVFFVSQGLVPPSELNKPRDKIDQDNLMDAVKRHNLEDDGAEIREVIGSLKYFKYSMVRNPLERLASAYRSKIERFNLTGNMRDRPHYNWARYEIFKRVHPHLFLEWVRGRKSEPIAISFSDLITYWLNPILAEFKFDDHFMSFLHICQPCRTRFDFYGNFRHFNRDAQVLIDKIGASSSDLRQSYYSDDSSSTDQRMKLYYSTLSETQKRDVLRKMALELEFHYTIFPEERDSHKQILGVDYELELP